MHLPGPIRQQIKPRRYALGVHSEVGQLRQAVVHRPGLELSRRTPANCRELLFDDALWAAKAREEHDAFAQSLRDHGVTAPLRRAPHPDARAGGGAGVRAGPTVHP